jgi:AbrB family looped-hinge helix DNA binding protein
MNKNEGHESKISNNFQILIPKEFRNAIGLKVGDTLVWGYDETKKQITLTPIPSSITAELFKIGKMDAESN